MRFNSTHSSTPAPYKPTMRETVALIRAVIVGFQTPEAFTTNGFCDAIPEAMVDDTGFLERFAQAHTPYEFRSTIPPQNQGIYSSGKDVAATKYKQAITPLFFDIFWNLALLGFLRPGSQAGGHISYSLPHMFYSLTIAGKEWLAGDPDVIVDSLAERLLNPQYD